MNQERRAKIEKLASNMQMQLEELRDLSAQLTSLQEEEQECFDNLPEGLQQAERGQSMEAIAAALEDALSSVDSALDDLDNSIEDVTSALEN